MKNKVAYPTKIFCSNKTCELKEECFRFLPNHSLASDLFYTAKKNTDKKNCENHIEFNKEPFTEINFSQ